MDVCDLRPTQGGLRLSTRRRRDMTAHVRTGGDFRSARAPHGFRTPIVIDRFPDDRLYVRDGQHRVTAVLVARPTGELLPGEYVIVDRSYAMYTELDLADAWCTPFDPRTEVRLADIGAFKARVRALLDDGADPSTFILSNRQLYCRPRDSTDTFDALATRWAREDGAC
jgi:hypothetical protein